MALSALASFAACDRATEPAFVITPGYSNIEAADYVGPETCGECHPDNHASWSSHPHRFMNAQATDETVLGDFSGVEISYQGFSEGTLRRVPAGRARFHRVDGHYTVSVSTPDGKPVRSYRVTKTVGTRVQQMYIGVQIRGPEPIDHPAYRTEIRLPYGFLVPRGEWHATPYFDHGLTMEDPAQPIPQDAPLGLDVWETNCATCHNTYPYAIRLQVKTSYHAGFRRRDFEGERAGPPKGAALKAKDLVTLGISCESCHFGGREHVVHGKPIRFVPVHDELRFVADVGKPEYSREGVEAPPVEEKKSPKVVNAICRQCHGRPVETYPGGGVCPNSAEGFDLAHSCGGQLKCTDCHNPHQAGPKYGGGPDNPKHIAACLRCHSELAEPAAQVAHAKHPAGTQVGCMDCHMPRVVMGLETVTRTHRVYSPTQLRQYVEGAPNACNLCHLDKTPRWALQEVTRLWGRAAPPSGAVRATEGERSAGELWLASSHHMTRMAAAHAYSRTPLGPAALEALIEAMDDSYPLVRVLVRPALETIIGRRLSAADYDIDGPRELRRQQLKAIVSAFRAAQPPPGGPAGP